MKTKLIRLFIAALLLSCLAVAGTLTGVTVTVTTAGTPVPVSATALSVRGFTIESEGTNTGTYIYIKDAAGHIMGQITKGQSFTPPQPTAPAYTLGGYDLSTVFIDASTSGDGVYVAYSN